ncbi:MAG: OmpA family protein [Bacteroidales bacterium]|nr:OmpA family protein [Bacteroidales bacterium]
MKQLVVFLTLLLSVNIHSQKQIEIIDFEITKESKIAGYKPVEFRGVDNEYFKNKFGITFHLDSCSSSNLPKYVIVGSPATSFMRNRSNYYKYDGKYYRYGHDVPHQNENFGSFFITDDGVIGNEFYSFYIKYHHKEKCSQASGYLIDVDGPERWIVNVYAKEQPGKPLQTISICLTNNSYWSHKDCDITDGGDGMGTYWDFNITPYSIDYIEFKYDSRASGKRAPGFCFDNFSFCSRENTTISEDTITETQFDTINWDSIKAGQTIILNNIEFEFNKSSLLPSSNEELQLLAQYLLENKDYKLDIIGHTDNLGNNDYNLNLSEKRAETVAHFLVGEGIELARISFKGCGEEQPLFPNDTESHRQKNRRVEFTIIE